jgi:signal transduction histidine kinase
MQQSLVNLIMSNNKRLPYDAFAKTRKIWGQNSNQIIDLLPCSISIQNSELRILFYNQIFKKNFGDAIGKRCYTVYKGANDICPSCPVKRSFRDKRIHIREETVKLLNGSRCQMLVQTSPIVDDHGKVAAVIDMATDITQVKTDQKELATLGQSIAVLSHGVKNILEGLQGGAYVVDEGIKDADLELVKKGWNIVSKNIFDVTDFVKNILHSSKSRRLRFEMVSPGQLVKDSVELFREKSVGLHIRLREQVNPYLPEVSVDIAGVRRVLNNLIWNAMDACIIDKQKKNHFVSVKTDFYDDDHFMFEIADNGIGMDQAIQQKIFDEFFSTKGSGGTGLGLAVVDKIVNMHSGKIEVTSTQGKGTKFTVILKIK